MRLPVAPTCGSASSKAAHCHRAALPAKSGEHQTHKRGKRRAELSQGAAEAPTAASAGGRQRRQQRGGHSQLGWESGERVRTATREELALVHASRPVASLRNPLSPPRLRSVAGSRWPPCMYAGTKSTAMLQSRPCRPLRDGTQCSLRGGALKPWICSSAPEKIRGEPPAWSLRSDSGPLRRESCELHFLISFMV